MLELPGIIHDCTPDYHIVSLAWMRPQVPDLKIDSYFSSQATRVIHVLGLFFGMLSMGYCTTRHLQTSGPLVQELNACTVSWRPLGVNRLMYVTTNISGLLIVSDWAAIWAQTGIIPYLQWPAMTCNAFCTVHQWKTHDAFSTALIYWGRNMAIFVWPQKYKTHPFAITCVELFTMALCLMLLAGIPKCQAHLLSITPLQQNVKGHSCC